MRGLGCSHPKPTGVCLPTSKVARSAQARNRPPRAHHMCKRLDGTPLSPTAAPPTDHYVRCAYAPLACPDAPKFPEISKKMSTWHIRDWPLSRGHGGPYPIVCSFEKGSNLGKSMEIITKMQRGEG